MFLSRGERDLGVAFQTHPGRQASISSGSKEPRSALELFREAKRTGFSDEQLVQIWQTTATAVRNARSKHQLAPVFKRVDTCAAEFESYTPYLYSSYEEEDEADV